MTARLVLTAALLSVATSACDEQCAAIVLRSSTNSVAFSSRAASAPRLSIAHSQRCTIRSG